MLTIIGCGNPNRRDDGVGVVVAQRLRERLAGREGVRVFDCGTAGMEVMFGARGSTHLVVVDACRSGSEPGSVFRVPGSELAQDHSPTFSLHDFRWDHALAAGRRIFADDFPERVDVFLVEAEDLGFGTSMTARVAAAVDAVVAQILELVPSAPAGADLPCEVAP